MAAPTRSTLLPGTATVLGLLAAAGLVVSVGPSGVTGYVSENGVAGAPAAALYRLSVVGMAVTVALLAWLLRRWPPVGPALAVAAPTIMLSAAVSCTEGCPLPPYEPTTPADLVHAAASLIGVGGCALAMLAAAWAGPDELRRPSRVAVSLGAPLMIGTLAGILAVGRGGLTGVLERLALAACVLWLLVTAAILWRRAARTGPQPRV